MEGDGMHSRRHRHGGGTDAHPLRRTRLLSPPMLSSVLFFLCTSLDTTQALFARIRAGMHPSAPTNSVHSIGLSTLGRRAVIGSGLSILAGSFGSSVHAAEEPGIPVYFGCGCFWHVQHEFVEAERRILGRSDLQFTSHTGYAGGIAGADRGKVCYHNAGFIADYGKLGHAEVVQIVVPPSKFSEFAREYCKLFDKNGYRPDQFGDKGPEYRNLVGFPGGIDSPFAKELVKASMVEGDKLDFAKGKGDDEDVRALAWIMDSDKFPFFAAEPYHQFHDGFNWGEDYPRAYNSLAAKQAKAGLIADTGCPNGMIGLGVAGL